MVPETGTDVAGDADVKTEEDIRDSAFSPADFAMSIGVSPSQRGFGYPLHRLFCVI
jgi:hypothetical protein